MRRLIAIEVSCFSIAIARADTHYDIVFYVGLEQAVMGVIWRAEKYKCRVGVEKIPINLFPLSVRVIEQRIIKRYWLEKSQWCSKRRVGCECRSSNNHALEESSS
jgi:hypothetical protein